MGKISWADRVSSEEVLHTVNEERNIVHTIKRRMDTRIGYVLRRNCLLKYFIEGRTKDRSEDDGRSCRITLRKRKGTGKRKK
jgi:hypothetical protein